MVEKTKRNKIIPVRVTDEMYQHLQELSDGYDIPIALYCYLAVRKAISFNDEICNHPSRRFTDNLIP